jgi:hypothetical protein
MANESLHIGTWNNGAVSTYPTTTNTFPSGLFGTQERNDDSKYSFNTARAIVTLPSSDLADGYLVLVNIPLNVSHNNRSTAIGQLSLTNGTGNFVSPKASGYARNGNWSQHSISVWAFVDSPSTGVDIQFTWFRDTGDGTVAGTVLGATFRVISLYYNDVSMYTSTVNNLYGGTTPNTVDLSTTVVEGTNITKTSNTVTVTGDNKKYLILSGHYSEGRGGRTQRWLANEYDATLARDAMTAIYYRDTGTDKMGRGITDIIETGTADRTINLKMWRGDGVSPTTLGGADQDGSTPAVTEAGLVVIELPDTAAAIKSTDNTGLQNLDVDDGTLPNISRNVVFDEPGTLDPIDPSVIGPAGYFIDTTNDILVGSNLSAAYRFSSGTRFAGQLSIIGGDEYIDPVVDYNYGRGAQSTSDTFGYSNNVVGIINPTMAANGGTVVTPYFAGIISFQGNDAVTQGPVGTRPTWVGAFALDLESLVPTTATKRYFIIS